MVVEAGELACDRCDSWIRLCARCKHPTRVEGCQWDSCAERINMKSVGQDCASSVSVGFSFRFQHVAAGDISLAVRGRRDKHYGRPRIMTAHRSLSHIDLRQGRGFEFVYVESLTCREVEMTESSWKTELTSAARRLSSYGGLWLALAERLVMAVAMRSIRLPVCQYRYRDGLTGNAAEAEKWSVEVDTERDP